MVPVGMDAWASFRSPDLFDPAMIPVTDGKKIPKSTKNIIIPLGKKYVSR